MKLAVATWVLLPLLACAGVTRAQEAAWPGKTTYHYQQIDGHRIFYRESGDTDRPTILLLHGYPSSSHQYRELIPLLSGYFHVIAPDNLGSGYSDKPSPSAMTYTFDVLAAHVDGLMDKLGIDRYVVYMQDFGAPVGFRVMARHPGRVAAIVLQNANAYIEGMPEAKREFFNTAATDRSAQNFARLRELTTAATVRDGQYLRDVKGREERVSPDSWTHDAHFLESEAERSIQVQLFQDYKTNLDSYPDWQRLIRQHQYPALIVWGERDPVFTAAGARAYLRDLPKAELHLLDAGHFAVEEKPVEIARYVIHFVDGLKRRPR